jgi:hypothetical protein
LNQGQHTRRVFPVTDNKAIPNVVSERAHWYLFASTKLQEVFTFISFHKNGNSKWFLTFVGRNPSQMIGGPVPPK